LRQLYHVVHAPPGRGPADPEPCIRARPSKMGSRRLQHGSSPAAARLARCETGRDGRQALAAGVGSAEGFEFRTFRSVGVGGSSRPVHRCLCTGSMFQACQPVLVAVHSLGSRRRALHDWPHRAGMARVGSARASVWPVAPAAHRGPYSRIMSPGPCRLSIVEPAYGSVRTQFELHSNVHLVAGGREGHGLSAADSWPGVQLANALAALVPLR
jgi:hypothetical protein